MKAWTERAAMTPRARRPVTARLDPALEQYLRRYPSPSPSRDVPCSAPQYRVADGVIASLCKRRPWHRQTLGCWAFYPDIRPAQDPTPTD
jgi:hypothetical protein